MRLRHLAKRTVERLLLLAPRAPSAMRGKALVLAYHNVIPTGHAPLGDASLHLPLQDFIAQVELLEEQGRVLPLADVLAGARSEDGPVVAITFDDAYRGAAELAFPELVRRGLPATVFVAPGLLGADSFWWDELAGSTGALDPVLRLRVLQLEAGRPRQRPLAGVLPRWYQCASEEDLIRSAGAGAITLGAHTWTHPNLTRLDPDDLALELNRPLEWLRRRGPGFIPVLSYPYGYASPAVECAARNAGYDAGLRIDGGWLTDGPNLWALPRFNVPSGLSLDGFRLRLSGLLPC